MIEESKKWIDILNFHHIQAPTNPEWQKLSSEIGGVMYYDSMVFVEKTHVLDFNRVRKGDFIPV